MDYPFFIRELTDIPKDIFDPLVEYLKKPNSHWGAHGYFKSGVDLQSIERKYHKELDYVVKKIVKHLDPWLPVTTYSDYSLNKLPGKSTIGEHSDINTFGSTEPMKYVLYHKIHIPITTNPKVVSLHRRSKNSPIEQTIMLPGKAYLYNDYVWHGGYNDHDEERVHMLIKYYDPNWSTRLNVLKKLGINEYCTYE